MTAPSLLYYKMVKKRDIGRGIEVWDFTLRNVRTGPLARLCNLNVVVPSY